MGKSNCNSIQETSLYKYRDHKGTCDNTSLLKDSVTMTQQINANLQLHVHVHVGYIVCNVICHNAVVWLSCIATYCDKILDLTGTIIASEASVAVTPEDVATLVDAVALAAGVRVAGVNLNCVCYEYTIHVQR